MRLLTGEEIDKIKLLTENSVELTLIELTKNGIEKSIMDATGPIRNYLKEKKLHDYVLQKQGPSFKIMISAFFINENNLTESNSTLYRPTTKKGDPRIWFKGLGNYAKPGDILGLIEFDRKLYVLNISQINIEKLIRSKEPNPLKELINTIKQISNVVVNDLLFLLRKIASSGPVPALLNADTAIGRTLEKLLGIDINSSKKPDYKGIELKSSRDTRENRKTLFAQVPDWKISKFKSSSEILNSFGYLRGNDIKLYCTVSTIVRNSQGLQLRLDNKANLLLENSDKQNIGDFVAWNLKTLHARLLEKHNETFWITATSSLIDEKEYFQYKKIEHTKKPIISQFDILLEQGIITVDHLIKKTLNKGAIEKGPLFKIKPTGIALLFPPSSQYSLI